MANVLIVDDTEMDRFAEGRIVEQAGHTAFFAGDGEAAMRMYKENDIALVITGLRMRKVDGLAIIAVSSLAHHLEKAVEYGAIAGLVKPVEPQDLVEAVEEILGKPPEAGSAAHDPWGSGL